MVSIWIYVVLVKRSITNSMEQSPSWESDWFSAGQEIPRVMEHERSLPYSQEPATCPYLSQMYPAHGLLYHLFKTCSTLSFHLNLVLPSSHFPYGFSTTIVDAFFFSHVRATCHASLRFFTFCRRYFPSIQCKKGLKQPWVYESNILPSVLCFSSHTLPVI
jgi:hypothetical protein